jgi:transcriptional regulator with XRE-family HTH domain
MASRKPLPVDVHIGHRIEYLRCLAGLTQKELAEGIGITFQQLQKYESGTNRIAASRLWTVAGALRAPIKAFFPASSGGLPPWQRDPAFRQWVQLYHSLPDEQRAMIIKIARAITTEKM